jgi:hypothetical protein
VEVRCKYQYEAYHLHELVMSLLAQDRTSLEWTCYESPLTFIAAGQSL